jgi:hypothetical protein
VVAPSLVPADPCVAMPSGGSHTTTQFRFSVTNLHGVAVP